MKRKRVEPEKDGKKLRKITRPLLRDEFCHALVFSIDSLEELEAAAALLQQLGGRDFRTSCLRHVFREWKMPTEFKTVQEAFTLYCEHHPSRCRSRLPLLPGALIEVPEWHYPNPLVALMGHITDAILADDAKELRTLVQQLHYDFWFDAPTELPELGMNGTVVSLVEYAVAKNSLEALQVLLQEGGTWKEEEWPAISIALLNEVAATDPLWDIYFSTGGTADQLAYALNQAFEGEPSPAKLAYLNAIIAENT